MFLQRIGISSIVEETEDEDFVLEYLDQKPIFSELLDVRCVFMEREYFQEFLKATEDAEVFCDVGGYHGFYSLVSYAEQNYCFEVDPENLDGLQKNLELNPEQEVNLQKKAVWNKSGKVNIDTGHGGKCHVSSTGLEREAVTLDSFFEDRADPDIIKIDVEGAEADVVLGGDNTLACEDLRAVLLEIHPKLLNNTTSKVRNIYSTFIDHGFDCYRFQDHRSTNLERKKIETSQSEITNLDENQMLLFSRS